MNNTENKIITKIVVDLSNWEEHYPCGCILYHGDEMIDSEFCDEVDEFTEFIDRYKERIHYPHTLVHYVIDSYDLYGAYNGSAIDCARKVNEYIENNYMVK